MSIKCSAQVVSFSPDSKADAGQNCVTMAGVTASVSTFLTHALVFLSGAVAQSVGHPPAKVSLLVEPTRDALLKETCLPRPLRQVMLVDERVIV